MSYLPSEATHMLDVAIRAIHGCLKSDFMQHETREAAVEGFHALLDAWRLEFDEAHPLDTDTVEAETINE